VEDARAVLAELGLAPERVHFELFHVDEPPPEVHRVHAGGVETSRLTVVLDGRSTETTADRDAPVLDSARAVRADVPFACTAGVCGTCRALVREGAVEMRRNYALERTELDAGFVLTCQARPVTDRVTVDYDA
jgi:ring-1,2-phenylacetyl-CoA epoxidase subunit PaaE